MEPRNQPPDTEAPVGTRALLRAGVIAGPIYVAAVLYQLLTTPGFDLRRHPMSLLMAGDTGWIQIANHVITGLLAIAFAIGIRRILPGGRRRTWGTGLLMVFGVGLVAGGIFVPDPALGFPPGTPDAIPTQFSWHAALHAIAPPLAFTALIAASFVFAGIGTRAWSAYSIATGVVALGMSMWPTADGISLRLAVGTLIGFIWLALMALRHLDRAPSTTAAADAERPRSTLEPYGDQP
jgi:hypothetical protein